MLGYVPYSFLEEHDISFGDPHAARKLYGLDHFDSLEALKQLSPYARRKLLEEAEIPYVSLALGNYEQLAPVIGWDRFMIDRAVYNDTPMPWNFSVNEGNFDEELIGRNLTGQGYREVRYGDFTYYHVNEDMEVDIHSQIGGAVLSQLNRVAVLDDMLVTAPATGIMTGVLEAMSGDVETVIDSPACRAIADSLGDVFTAVLITPERVMNFYVTQTPPSFDFPTAAGWGTLHRYGMLGIGYRNDGKERYWDTCLYYEDASAAQADAGELVSRLKSYVFYTQFKPVENVPLTSLYEVGEPIIREYKAGATLTVSCRYLAETTGGNSFTGIVVPARDFLFLAPDPMPYIDTGEYSTTSA